MISAPISEIYASVQGEGPYAGERQIFVRLAGCPLRCRYCDTPDSLVSRGHPRQTVAQVASSVVALRRRSRANTVSVTGGEPLIQPAFLKELFSRLKKLKFRTYLETAGIHPKALVSVIDAVDVVSMDVKLPSAIGRSMWRDHAEFLKVGADKIFVKIVIDNKSTLSEIKRAVLLLRALRRPPLLVLQPATAILRQVEAPSVDQIADAYAEASSRLPRVLVMPQQHKIWSVR